MTAVVRNEFIIRSWKSSLPNLGHPTTDLRFALGICFGVFDVLSTLICKVASLFVSANVDVRGDLWANDLIPHGVLPPPARSRSPSRVSVHSRPALALDSCRRLRPLETTVPPLCLSCRVRKRSLNDARSFATGSETIVRSIIVAPHYS